MEDAIDRAAREWASAWPRLDTSPSDVLARIQRLSQLIDEQQNRRLRRRSGMTVANLGDFDVLRALRRAGPPYALTPTQLRQAMLVSGAGLTGRLKRLEDEGWITRSASPQDGRSTVVRLTPEGVADLDRDLDDHFAFEARLLKSLNAGEQQDLAGKLRQLLLALDEHADGTS
ncbi:MarR family transcriptional regulator [Saccharopolyspora indica]|uniref:MarR family winged helix-turn-helix transcriptional regulator n=1 Tax=Saccharopolyspora indica TaxID=1229659 RepID=UPI0022EB32E2|nr:MarR family transcriptional regulator [Saccharopolyspora indica]MDA3643098.1 MarR family transcriptional regulator [Saccharopolyspora indica]